MKVKKNSLICAVYLDFRICVLLRFRVCVLVLARTELIFSLLL